MEGKIVIAIDGHSASGKSTLAKDLARELGILHIDSGAMYRAVALLLIQHNVQLNDRKGITSLLEELSITFMIQNGEQHVFLNGTDVTREIRSAEVNQIVSEVAAISEVRRKLVSMQQDYALDHSLVMDGRDIGTVVFPNADIKFFVTAGTAVRTERRLNELIRKGQHPEREEVKINLAKRDHIDSTRADSPLRQAEDAILLDNSSMDRREQLQYCLKLIRKLIGLRPL
jgi:cytidylate kinase